MTVTPAPRLTIVIPTYKRPEGLQQAVRSVFKQSFLEHETARIIIVDNDPNGSALTTAQRLQNAAPETLDITILHEPNPGVANARNTAMAAVDTPLVAFLDDDQSAPERWLANLIGNYDRFGGAITFGPVKATLPGSIERHRDYFRQFFSRGNAHEDGPINTFYGCGNALLDVPQLPVISPMFDTRMNETGGEDDLLFSAALEAGCKIVWSRCAYVFEHVPASRAKLTYTMRRAMAYGQGPCTLARMSGRKGKLAMWTLIGAGQTVIYGAIALSLYVLRSSRRAFWLDRAARGFGKVVWWRAFRFYGASVAPAPPPLENPGRVELQAQA